MFHLKGVEMELWRGREWLMLISARLAFPRCHREHSPKAWCLLLTSRQGCACTPPALPALAQVPCPNTGLQCHHRKLLFHALAVSSDPAGRTHTGTFFRVLCHSKLLCVTLCGCVNCFPRMLYAVRNRAQPAPPLHAHQCSVVT